MQMIRVIAILFTGLFAVTGPAMAMDPGPQDRTYAPDGVAIQGYDPVAYFTVGEAMRGDVKHATTYNGVTWHFASPENMAMFQENPEQYMPAFGGFCATGAAKGAKVAADPTVWQIENGTLYLQSSEGAHQMWMADKDGMIQQGMSNWAGLEDRPFDYN